MNTNGLISSRDVSATGRVESNFFLRKGDTLPATSIVSPLTVLSPDATEQTVLSVTNDGTTKLLSQGFIDLEPEAGSVYIATESTNEDPAGLFIQPTLADGVGILRIYNGNESVHYDFSVSSIPGAGRSADDLQIFASSQAGIVQVLDVNVQGTVMLLGSDLNADGCIVQVNGPEGASRVFDEVYNPPPAFQMRVDPAASVALLYNSASSTSVAGSFKRYTLDAVPPFTEQNEIPSIFLGGTLPDQSNIGDTYGLQFQTVTAGSRVAIYNTNSDPSQPAPYTLAPVAGEVYWFVCNAQNEFIPVGTMTAMPLV